MYTLSKFSKLWSLHPFLEGLQFLWFRTILRSLRLVKKGLEILSSRRPISITSSGFAPKCAPGQQATQTARNGASGADFHIGFRWTSTWGFRQPECEPSDPFTISWRVRSFYNFKPFRDLDNGIPSRHPDLLKNVPQVSRLPKQLEIVPLAQIFR